MLFTRKEQNAILREFSSVASCLTGRRITVVAIIDGDDLGYTSDDNKIHVSLSNEYFRGLSKSQVYVLIRGIFAHELLHQLITNFKEYFPAIKNHERYEQSIIASIMNICEDSAIEFFAPGYLSEEYTRSLEYMRALVYKHQPEIQENEDAFGQFFTAILQYRFFGFLKGKFTFPESNEAFRKSVAPFNVATENPIQKERIKCAEQILDISRPLWEDRAKSVEQMRQMMEEIMQSFASAMNNGEGEGSDDSNPEDGDSSLTKRRRITFKRVSPEEYKKAMENAKDGPDAGGDIQVLIPDSPVEDDDTNPPDVNAPAAGSPSSNAADENKSDADGAIPKSDSTNAADSDSSPSAEHDSDASNTDSEPESNAVPDTNNSSEEGVSEREGGDTLHTPEATGNPEDLMPDMTEEIDRELELSDSDISAIAEVNQRYEAEEKHLEAYEDNDLEDINIPVTGGYKDVCKGISCENVWVKCPKTSTAITTYESIVASMNSGIQNLAHQLKRMLKNRQEEKMYKQSGKVCLKRLNCGRMTTRVFTKNRLPETSDVAVVVAIDISGSMSGRKIAAAQKAAIGLAEVCGQLKLSLYMFGFTADEHGYKANHYHYLNWSNRKDDRHRLLSIKACSDNFDGYSIRYATKLLQKRSEEKKLLFIISDGNPAAMAYRHVNGIQDVQLAINEANKVCIPVGILLGNIDPSIHRQMYGYNFIHCEDVKNLFPQLGKILKRYL